MSSSVVAPVAQAIANVIGAVDFTPRLRVFWPVAVDLSSIPAAVVNLPTIRRTGLDEGERELGSDDWLLTYPVELLVDLADAKRDHLRVVDLVEAVIAAIDNNPTLGDPTIDDAKAVAGEPAYDLTETSRPLLTYDLEVQVWKRVPTT